jgi:hypothetical protein
VQAFQAQQRPVCFETTRLSPSEHQLREGVDQSVAFVVFVTKAYMRQVQVCSLFAYFALFVLLSLSKILFQCFLGAVYFVSFQLCFHCFQIQFSIFNF